jgi:ATP-dependent DNA ligase
LLTNATVKVFDLLYLNGQPLVNKSTKFRKRNLKTCIKEIQGRIELVVDFEARTANDVRKRMEEVMATRGEGLVMKHPDAGYILNGRNKDWIKVSLGDDFHRAVHVLSVVPGQARVYGERLRDISEYLS